jgi:hypothetical protein
MTITEIAALAGFLKGAVEKGAVEKGAYQHGWVNKLTRQFAISTI